MKKKILITLLTVFCILLAAGVAGWYFAVDIVGEKVFDTMLESVDEEALQKADEVLKKLPDSEKTEKAGTEENEEKSDGNIKKNESAAKEAEAVTDRKIEFADKQAALNLAYSKFSQAEINAGLAKLQRGLTKEEYNYYIALAKSRFTQAEIEQIKAWYYKYR